MRDAATLDTYGQVSEPATLTIQRLLPGPIERVWAYVTDSELRRQWLAAGQMDMTVGAPFELVWDNNTLTNPPGTRPADLTGEHRMESRITALEPLRKIAFTWNGSDDVSMELEPRGDRVLLTVIHRRLPSRNTMLMVSAGWHAHLDLLAVRVSGGSQVEPFWDVWSRLRQEYDERLPG